MLLRPLLLLLLKGIRLFGHLLVFLFVSVIVFSSFSDLPKLFLD